MADATPAPDSKHAVPQVKAEVVSKFYPTAEDERKVRLNNANAVASNVREYEDEFVGKYGDGKLWTGISIMEPPFNPKQLEDLVYQNNAIWPCIEAMITNIDGTGFSIEPKNPTEYGEEKTSPEKEYAEDFFREVFPGESFQTVRKKLRKDIETTGNGYLEVLRTATGELAFVRHVEAKTMRVVRLDEPVAVPVTLYRGNKPVVLTVLMRYRRFVQSMAGKYVFFKEYGAKEQLHKETGYWERDLKKASDKEQITVATKATEILWFRKARDVSSPYGVPVWITNIPSVLGSRRAEEFNLDFFDSGGVPPVLVMVQGGAFAKEAREALDAMLNTKGPRSHRAAILEAYSTTGNIGDAANVKVTVERFGAEQKNDSMFEKYDDKAETRIRRSWRLPPIMVGKSEDYNFATAITSYTVAEAQVFRPERDEFDEVINNTLMRELVGNKYVFRSMPVAVRDIEKQIVGLKMAFEAKAITRRELTEKLNELLGLGLEVAEIKDLDLELMTNGNGMPHVNKPDSDPMKAPRPSSKESLTRKSDTGIKAIVDEIVDLLKEEQQGEALSYMLSQIVMMTPEDQERFRAVLKEEVFGEITSDPAGLGPLLGSVLAGFMSEEPGLEDDFAED